MNILKFFRRQGFKKIATKYFAMESLGWGDSAYDKRWNEYKSETDKTFSSWFSIIELRKNEIADYRATSRLLFDSVKHNCLSLDLNDKEIVYIFCDNQMHYTIILINKKDKIYSIRRDILLEDHGTENSFNENLKSVIGTVRYRDYVLTQIFKKEVKI